MPPREQSVLEDFMTWLWYANGTHEPLGHMELRNYVDKFKRSRGHRG
jgi:hypothetical protein